jgi:hypothetical protein
MEAIGFEFVLLDLYDIVFILAIALSVLLRFTYSNYLFGIFQLFLPRKMSIQSFPFDSIDPSKNSRLFMFVNNLQEGKKAQFCVVTIKEHSASPLIYGL